MTLIFKVATIGDHLLDIRHFGESSAYGVRLGKAITLEGREIVFNWTEVAKVWEVSGISVWRYRQQLPPIPLPAFKSFLKQLAEDYGIPRRRGSAPKEPTHEKHYCSEPLPLEDIALPIPEQSPESPVPPLRLRFSHRPILNRGRPRTLSFRR